jgi:hypothetical protein
MNTTEIIYIHIKTHLIRYANHRESVIRVYPEDEGHDLEGYFYDGKISGAECEQAMLRAYDHQSKQTQRDIMRYMKERRGI